MTSKRILYLGDQDPGTTSWHRSEALRRQGHHVEGFNPRLVVPRRHIWYALHYRLGFRFIRSKARRAVQAFAQGRKFDVLWINSGDYTGPDTVAWARGQGMRIVSYNNDDPFGGRDGAKWANYLACLPVVDLAVVMRGFNVEEARARGARRVLRVFMSCDEVAHRPRPLTDEIRRSWASDVAFIGTWMPERGPFIAELLKRGIPVSVWGNRWEKAPEWEAIRGSWRGGAVEGDNYAYAIQCAKVVLGLLSKGNRDLHTTRTAEVPYLGSALCAEDTVEHRGLFEHGMDAYLFNNSTEAATGLRELLADEPSRLAVAEGGRRRIIAAGLTNEAVTGRILAELYQG